VRKSLSRSTAKAARGTKRVQGFTLIEFLVVIAIIALLAAILFPVFARVREKARQATCQSNETQIGIAIVQYVDDFDDTFPTTYGGGWNLQSGGTSWTSSIAGYLKNTQVLTCPSSNQKTNYVTYQMNAYLGGVASTNGMHLDRYVPGSGCYGNQCTAQAASLPMILTPSTTILLVEDTDAWYEANGNGAGWVTYMGGNNPCGFSSTLAEATAYESPVSYMAVYNFVNEHTNGENITFCDGHVKYFPAAHLMTLGNGGGAETLAGFSNCSTSSFSVNNHNNGDVDFVLQ